MRRIGVMPGAFNPLTSAHLALVEAARQVVDEVICVVPRAYPHKEFHGATWEQRVEMLLRARGPYRVETCAGGLFVDIARDLRRDLSRDSGDIELHFICGRDAAERVLHWDYGDQGPVERILDEFALLVAARQGEFTPPGHLRHRIAALPIPAGLDDHSSSEVRRRIATGEPWAHLVPEPIVELISRVYSQSNGGQPVY